MNLNSQHTKLQSEPLDQIYKKFSEVMRSLINVELKELRERERREVEKHLPKFGKIRTLKVLSHEFDLESLLLKVS